MISMQLIGASPLTLKAHKSSVVRPMTSLTEYPAPKTNVFGAFKVNSMRHCQALSALNGPDFFLDPSLLQPVSSDQSNQRPPRLQDQDLGARATEIVALIEKIKSNCPAPVLNHLIDGANRQLQKPDINKSMVGKLLKLMLDEVAHGDGQQLQEYVYVLLKSDRILNESIRKIDGQAQGGHLLVATLLDVFDDIISQPLKLDRFGMLGLGKQAVDVFLGDNKRLFYDILTNTKDGLLERAGKTRSGSFSEKLRKVLALGIAVDMNRDTSVESVSNAIQDIGIIAVKLCQTIGGQVNNPHLPMTKSGRVFLQACESLQQRNRPMSAAQAQQQMAKDWEPKLGKDWQSKLFKTIDFSHPVATASIAGVYKAVAVNGEVLAVKISKPGLMANLEQNKRDFSSLLDAMYEILGEVNDSFRRQGQHVPELLSKAGLFEKSKASFLEFCSNLASEIYLPNEARNMREAKVLTPEVRFVTENTLATSFIHNAVREESGIKLTDYVVISDRTKMIDFKKASTAKEAIQGWVQSHYPFEIKKDGIHGDLLTSGVEVHFKNRAPLRLEVTGKAGDWKVNAAQPYIDYGLKARELIAAQNIVDLLVQLKEGVVNADAHGGNFMIAAGNAIGENKVYNLDWGLVARIDNNDKGLVWNFMKGVLLNDERSIGRTYFNTTTKGQMLSPQEYKHELEQFSRLLRDTKYLENLRRDPDQAMGPVMEWLAANDFNIDAKYYALVRAVAGVATNATSMQGGRPVSMRQLGYVAGQVTGLSGGPWSFISKISSAQRLVHP